MSAPNSELIDEELSSYLDGELPSNQAAELEQRLVRDENLRRRLAEMRRAVDMLEEIPETPQNQAFTQSTIAMVVADVKKSSTQASGDVLPRPRGSWFAWPAILVPLLSAIAVGAIVGTIVAMAQMRFELVKLGLFTNVTGLQDVRDFAVAQAVAEEGPLVDFLAKHYSERIAPPLPASLWERRQWMLRLNPVQIATLESGREMVSKLPPETIARLDAMQSQVEADPGSESLEQTLRVVGAVLDSFPSSKRQDLDGLKQEDRIRFLIEQLCFRAAMFYAAEMPSDDSQALENWSKSELMPTLVANMPFFRREDDVRLMLMTLYARRAIEDGYRLDGQDELVASLANAMSPFAKRLLEGIDRNDQLIVITTWLVPEGMNNERQLIEAYDRMRRELRDEIDLADPNNVRRMMRERSRRPPTTTTRNRG